MVGWSFTRSRSPGFTPLLIQTTQVCQKTKNQDRLQELWWQEGGAVSRHCHSLQFQFRPTNKPTMAIWKHALSYHSWLAGVSSETLTRPKWEKGHEKEPGIMFFICIGFFLIIIIMTVEFHLENNSSIPFPLFYDWNYNSNSVH